MKTNTNVDKYLDKQLHIIADRAWSLKDKLRRELNKKLREKYVGRRVKCSCFDTWEDGDSFTFDQELKKITVNESADGYFLTVAFLIKPLYWNKGRARLRSFVLESIEKVY